MRSYFNQWKINEVHISINGKLTRMLFEIETKIEKFNHEAFYVFHDSKPIKYIRIITLENKVSYYYLPH
jgi:hypothetical protein